MLLGRSKDASKAFSSSPKLIEEVSGLIQVLASRQDELGSAVPLPLFILPFGGLFSRRRGVLRAVFSFQIAFTYSAVQPVFVIIITFIYVILAVLGLCCWVGFLWLRPAGAFSGSGARVSHISGFSRGAWALEHAGFRSCGSLALELGLSS